MSVHINKINGKVDSIHIYSEDVYNILKSIAYLIDLSQEGAGLNIAEFQNNENHKAIMLLMREF